MSHFSQEVEVLQGLGEKFDAVGRKLEKKWRPGDAKFCGTFLVAMILSPQLRGNVCVSEHSIFALLYNEEFHQLLFPALGRELLAPKDCECLGSL